MKIDKNNIIELLENELQDYKELQEKYKDNIDESIFYNGSVSAIEYLIAKIKE